MRNKLVIVICLGLMAGLTLPVQAGLPVEEYGLNPNGGAYEINADGQGGLWISDFGATPGEIVRVEASTGVQTVYPILWGDPENPTNGSPSDARRIGNSFWWVDPIEGFIGRGTVTDGRFWLWSVESLTGLGESNLFSLAVDGNGDVWASDTGNPWIYRLTVDAENSASLCMYTFGNPQSFVFNHYIAYKNGYLWIGDNFSNRILRVAVANNTLTWWNLPSSATLFSLAVDNNGDVWATDYFLPDVYQLEPTLNRLTSYHVPQGIIPMMITFEGDRVILSASDPASIAILNPTKAVSSTAELSVGEGVFTSTCDENPVIPTEGTATPTNRPTPPTPTEYPLQTINLGWDIYQAPKPPLCNSRYPWGIANESGIIWVVDNYCSQLIKFSPPNELIPSLVFLPFVRR